VIVVIVVIMDGSCEGSRIQDQEMIKNKKQRVPGHLGWSSGRVSSNNDAQLAFNPIFEMDLNL
jgi:hypothetical protein